MINTKFENEIQNEITKKINAQWHSMELNRLVDAMMMKESMQEELELEDELAMRVDPMHSQGWPRAMLRSPGWSASPLEAAISRFTALESLIIIKGESLLLSARLAQWLMQG